ncbi:hypothetical protein KKC94_03020 [Patescibacteria group bacterium]|nr:hypothetical protein [Patescibacteria group bacterium]
MKKIFFALLISLTFVAFGCSKGPYTDYNNQAFGIYFEMPGEMTIEREVAQPFMGKYFLSLRFVDANFAIDDQEFQTAGNSVSLLVNSLDFGADNRYPADHVTRLSENSDGSLSMTPLDSVSQNKQTISFYGDLRAKNGNFYQFTIYTDNEQKGEEIFKRVIESAKISEPVIPTN